MTPDAKATHYWSIPLFLRLPLVAAALVLAGSVVALQFSLLAQRPDLEARATAMGKRYVASVADQLEPFAISHDSAKLAETLNHVVAGGTFDRPRAVYIVQPEHKVTMGKAAVGQPLVALPHEVFDLDDGAQLSDDGTFVWAWRPIDLKHPDGPTVVAALDIGRILQRQRTLMFQMIGICIAVATLAAVLCFFLMRRIMDPIQRVANHMALAGQGQLEPIADIPSDRELAALALSFNTMVAATRDREMMLLTLAEQDRAAVLGRLVASIVHEVRNPLAGMLASIETIRRFGKDGDTREEALSLIQRGLNSIGDVIDASLETYRFPRMRRNLTREDLADVETLIEAETRQRNLRFERAISLKGEVNVSALEARQILLNLLLNACEATAAGGIVSFAAHVSGDAIEFTISDSGAGLSPAMIEAIREGTALPPEAGLGLPIVLRLVRRLGGNIRATAPQTGGTVFSLSLPLKEMVTAQ